MKIKNIIEFLESQGDWVNRHFTRDHILIGTDETEIKSVIVCWVATLDVINKAVKNDCHLIISHENPFYMASTSLPTVVLHAQKEKMKLLNDNNITIYRCHDLWDLYPKYGVRDQWAKTLGFDFDLKKSNKFLCYADNINLTTEQLAHHVIKCIKPYYQFGIELIGNKDKVIKKVGIGTGACTDIFEMYENNVDACIVSDDGINNWVNVQWAMDHNLPLLVINHLTSEAPGIKELSNYLSKHFTDIQFEYINSDYGIYHIS